MASVIQELSSILEEELEIYEKLIPIVTEKTKVIIKNNLETLQKITEQEQMVVDKVTALEKRRAEVIVNIAIVMNKKPDELTLAEIIQMLENQPEEQKHLSEVHSNLKRTVQRLMNINSQNKSLMEQSLEMIEFNMNLIQSTRITQGNNYTRGAVTSQSAALHPGMFDAKQ